ncbi:MAG: hypothetical protein C6W58_08295 [Bacillaceae bacterium]|uniref:Uncharacterized protein n=1 Tax=Aeribacillus pallidus TaxID=33936 RepID=A0A165Z6N4_9BACI|nr:hypothetical protein A3Q35_14080 [Aeribacillus pallidus]KZN97909.1 hypothetical protein AZI98_00875 [Aeribacillus pallidus]REJ17674.1 MAG: hypothetical protein C6W58_08295 [Bacillaceae bacterium]REJ21011.1 MAG: hypothetical protein C6W54_18675 [Bacillaceae bacterium]
MSIQKLKFKILKSIKSAEATILSLPKYLFYIHSQIYLNHLEGLYSINYGITTDGSIRNAYVL